MRKLLIIKAQNKFKNIAYQLFFQPVTQFLVFSSFFSKKFQICLIKIKINQVRNKIIQYSKIFIKFHEQQISKYQRQPQTQQQKLLTIKNNNCNKVCGFLILMTNKCTQQVQLIDLTYSQLIE
ncbi:hypothetical protein ABPG74_016909 [Tetrahymena malaccensis]